MGNHACFEGKTGGWTRSLQFGHLSIILLIQKEEGRGKDLKKRLSRNRLNCGRKNDDAVHQERILSTPQQRKRGGRKDRSIQKKGWVSMPGQHVAAHTHAVALSEKGGAESI